MLNFNSLQVLIDFHDNRAYMGFTGVHDFFNSLIYINSTSKYTVPLALRMSLDISGIVNWNSLMAISLLAILPLVVLFIFTQKYFVDGIMTTGIKG